MAKITFTGNVKGIIKKLEDAESELKLSTKEALQQLSKEAFNQVGNKYIVKGRYATPSDRGSKMNLTAPPGANISAKRKVRYDKKTHRKIYRLVPMFVKGKVVSRFGNYEQTMGQLASNDFNQENTKVDSVRVEIKDNSLKVYVDPASNVYKMETKRGGGQARKPITKAFSSIVSLWKRMRVRLGK